MATATSCVLLWLISNVVNLHQSTVISYSLLAVLSLLACVEKLCSIMNTISVERDWVVVIAQGNEARMRGMLQVLSSFISNSANNAGLNSEMRRIDLFCKLAGPLTIALIDGISIQVAMIAVFAMTCLSVLIEYFAIARVYKAVPALQEPKPISGQASSQNRCAMARLQAAKRDLASYVQHRAFLPSFALALLYLTVLSFNGQMVTYLLSVGLGPTAIGLLRGVSAAFEMSATWLAPRVIKRIGTIRAGIWFINWQIACLAFGVTLFWMPWTQGQVFAVSCVVAAVIASRVGLWGFDLSVQEIVQEVRVKAPDLTISSKHSSICVKAC